MIINFSVENFMSINEKQDISFKISKVEHLNDSSRELNNGKICNTITAVVGNNASGKTNILKALAFLLWFSKKSYSFNAPFDSMVLPHVLSGKNTSSFELNFEKEGTEYIYKLVLTNKRLDYEYFGKKQNRGFSYLYEVHRKENDLNVTKWSSELGKLNENDKKRFLGMHLCSFFSFLLSTGYLVSLDIDSLYPYVTNIGSGGKGSEDSFLFLLKTSESLKADDRKREKINSFLRECDLGFSSLEFCKGVLATHIKGQPEEEKELEILGMNHQVGNKMFQFPLLQESNGTQKLVNLLNRIIPTIEKGGIVIWDELEDAIHPFLAKKIVQLFKSRNNNLKNAQLLFTTHAPLLLDECTKTQIYLVEKNEKLESDLYRLDDVEGVRNGDNFSTKYISGAYGAVPQGRWF